AQECARAQEAATVCAGMRRVEKASRERSEGFQFGTVKGVAESALDLVMAIGGESAEPVTERLPGDHVYVVEIYNRPPAETFLSSHADLLRDAAYGRSSLPAATISAGGQATQLSGNQATRRTSPWGQAKLPRRAICGFSNISSRRWPASPSTTAVPGSTE